jgi:predicted Rossmann fold flavoprotein
MAAGGLSFPRTGSDGAGYALVTALGHTLEPPVPALTPLAAMDPLSATAQGVTVDAELTLRVGGPVAERVRGSLLFTHFGYSGPAALDLSRHWLRAEGPRERLVTANFAPGESAEDVHEWLKQASIKSPRVSARRMLGRWIPERVAAALCREAGVGDGSVPIAQLPRVNRVRLVERLVSRPMPVSGTLGYEKAEVTAGGVRLDEVNPSTLESRKVPGLYLCGEIVDVEGRLGGFNFQWSWSSGTVAGRASALALHRVP